MSVLIEIGRLWHIWLPLVCGALAIYRLLPRTRPVSVWRGVGMALVALVLGGVLLVPCRDFLPEPVLFYCFSGIALLSGGFLVTQQNPARAALSFAVVVLAVCGLFLLLAAPFLMAATTIIYAGAIIVTFLFVIMLAQQEGYSSADDRSREPMLSTFTAFLLLFALLYVLQRATQPVEADDLAAQLQRALNQTDGAEIDRIMKMPAQDRPEKPEERSEESLFRRTEKLARTAGLDTSELMLREVSWGPPSVEEKKQTVTYLLALTQQARSRAGLLMAPPTAALSDLSGPPANTPPEQIRRDPESDRPKMPHENSAYLGRSLFTDYLLPVELGGMLLLVATIGAIAIAHRRPAGQETRP